MAEVIASLRVPLFKAMWNEKLVCGEHSQFGEEVL